MYQESLEEVNEVKSEYEAKLISANDSVRETKAENESLKEKVDILFKLGKSYIDNGKRNKENKDNNKNKPHEEDDEIKTVEEDKSAEIDLTEDDLETWTKSKMRGFRRTTPSIKSTSKNTVDNKSTKQRNVSFDDRFKDKRNDDRRKSSSTEQTPEKIKHCHYFVNFGSCNFECRTGRKCKFEHKEAPPCHFGSGCTREKCQFSHPKSQSGSFLDKRQNSAPPLWQSRSWQSRPQPPPPSPWQINPWPVMMNPWSQQHQAQWPPLEKQRHA